MKKLLSRKTCLLLAVIFAAAGSGCGDVRSPDTPKRNVLLITLDTLRADHLGSYGYGRDTSPSIDSLASGSFIFEHAVAQSAITPVSHASIMTGLNPFRHGLRSLHGGEGFELPEARVTLAEILRDNGYETGAFVSAFPVTRRYGLHQGFETWDEEFAGNSDLPVVNDKGIVNTGHVQRRADETAEKAVSWLRRQSGEKPFFAWVHFFDVHDPLILPPQEYLRKFPPKSLTRPDQLRAIYDAEINFVDDQVKRILGELESLGVRGDTIVAVIADHGEGLGDHDWWGHGILYQEQIRVPFILSIPGQGEGRKISSLVRSVDLLPTLADLLELDLPPGLDFDGESLIGILEGREERELMAYSESINDLVAYYDSPMRNESLYAITEGRWKLIVHREESEDRRVELFDLRADPGELRDVSGSETGQAARLRGELDVLDAVLDEPPRAVMDEGTKERLKALGYIR